MQSLQISMLKTCKLYIHFNCKNARDLKFWMRLPCVAILKILLFGHFMAKNPIWPPLFGSILAIGWPERKIFKIATPNLWNATQASRIPNYQMFAVPSMFAVQMNVPFVSFRYHNSRVLHVLYLQAIFLEI